jgi:hypothetical protein
MPQTCTVCRQPNVAEIERAIVGGEPLRDIARQYGVSKDAVARHKSDHLPRTLVKAHDAQEVVRAGGLMDYLQRRQAGLEQMDEDVREIQQEAKRENDRHGVLEAVKTRAGIVSKQLQLADLFGRATGEFGGAAPVQQNILVQVLSLPKIGETLGSAPDWGG